MSNRCGSHHCADGFGKSISKLGRLALIGAEVGMDATYTSELVSMMKEYLAPWLEGSNPNALRYDQTYGGVVSTNGIKDQGADFGQGVSAGQGADVAEGRLAAPVFFLLELSAHSVCCRHY